MPTTAPPAGTTGLSYADLLELPGPDGGVRYELLDSELLVTPAPSTRHQDAVLRIGVVLFGWCQVHGGRTLPAPTDVWFDDQTVFEPDLLVVTAEHLDRIEATRVVGPPDLVVEVSSPTTRRTDLVRKRRVYERRGVPEFWFVDLDVDQVHVYTLSDRTYGPPTVVLAEDRIVSAALRGLDVPASELLALDAG